MTGNCRFRSWHGRKRRGRSGWTSRRERRKNEKADIESGPGECGADPEGSSESLGICEQTLSNYERGISYPDVPMIEKFVGPYGVSYDDLQWRVE